MAEVEGASAPATNGATRVEYELQLYYWMKLIRGFEDRVPAEAVAGTARATGTGLRWLLALPCACHPAPPASARILARRARQPRRCSNYST